MAAPIRTPRLDLVPLSVAFLAASVDGRREDAERLLGATVPETWPDDLALVGVRLAELREDPSLAPWLLRAIVHRDTRTMVGHAGFHTRPGPPYLEEWAPGGVELGYTVFEPFRRRGFAREAARGLLEWAASTQGVRRFVMSIRPDNAASRRIADALGFVRIGSHQDPVDGLEDVLALRLEGVVAAD